MLISAAFAHDSGNAGTGSSGGGGIALLIILGSGITLYLLYAAGMRWRRRKLERGGEQ